jgi:putative endonuclease
MRRSYHGLVKGSSRWFVYLVRCADGSIYTGISNDVAARLAMHDRGKGARYTRGRGPVTLLAAFRCATKPRALQVEYAVKRLPRDAKLELATRRTLRDAIAFTRAHARTPPPSRARAARRTS